MRRFLFALFCFYATACPAQQPVDQQNLIQYAQQYFTKKMVSDHIVGLSAAVVLHGQVVWKEGFGYADRENKVAMTSQTVVNIGSITKTFTALAVMQLNEQGKLDIDKPLKDYLPEFHPKSRPGMRPDQITIKSIITHTSGIQSDYWKNSDLESGRYTDVLGFINQTFLLYPAGMVGLYSNAGYNILGSLIKSVSHEEYARYIHQHIMTPLGMVHSGFAMDSLTNRSKIYAYGKNFKAYELRDIASGGIYTDIDDFSRYAMALLQAYQGKESAVIKPEMIQQMFTLQNASVPIETNKKGLGWFMFKNDSTFAVYHAGSAGFAQAKLLLFPKNDAAVIVMTNTAEGGSAAENFCFDLLPKFGLSVADIFPAPITGPLHDLTHEITLTQKELEKNTGCYARSGSYVRLSVDRDCLKMREGKSITILKPLGSNEFAPYVIQGNDTVMQHHDQRFFFKDIQGYHFLIERTGKREHNWGYRLKPVDTLVWEKRIGLYEQFGYQMLIGDSKFKSVEIYLTPDQVLMCRLRTMGSSYEIPLDVIDSHHALSSGVNSGFGGFTVSFRESRGHQIVDFAGLTFRKERE
jgi:CubicO group peptidase (beta-lactamase class C family)